MKYAFVIIIMLLNVAPNSAIGRVKRKIKHRRKVSKIVKRKGFKNKKIIKRSKIKGHWKKNKRGIKILKRRQYGRIKIEKVKRDKRKFVPKRAKKLSNLYPSMKVYRIHTREIAYIKLYDSRGFIRKSGLQKFSKLVRCYRKNVTIPINYHVITEIYRAWLYFGQPQVTVFSGCRQPPYATKTSRHVHGNAIDFSFDGIRRRRIVNYFLKRSEKVHGYHLGVGYYPESFHVHLDARKKKNAFWVQLVRENGTGYYAENPFRTFYRSYVHYGKSKNSKLSRR